MPKVTVRSKCRSASKCFNNDCLQFLNRLMARITESENPFTKNIDQLETVEALGLINTEDKSVAAVISGLLDDIAGVADSVYRRLAEGGSLFYVGTGTSGRLGVLDAAELPPTFGVSTSLVQGVIAGGYGALYKSVEASEDNKIAGVDDLKKRGLRTKDAVIGITASGTTPYTLGAVEYAGSIGCFTSCITCNPGTPIARVVDVAIVAVVGPEVITGSTRLKSGTAQKMILNMISTMVMIKLGYVKGNRMINVRASNAKLVERSLRLLASETGLGAQKVRDLFEASGRDLRSAVVMNACGVTAEEAKKALLDNGLAVKKAIDAIRSGK